MYDEPTAGLDPVASTVVEDLIRSLHVNKASYSVYSSSDGCEAVALQRHVSEPYCASVAALLPCECTPPLCWRPAAGTLPLLV
jgi:hypothetical protein